MRGTDSCLTMNVSWSLMRSAGSHDCFPPLLRERVLRFSATNGINIRRWCKYDRTGYSNTRVRAIFTSIPWEEALCYDYDDAAHRCMYPVNGRWCVRACKSYTRRGWSDGREPGCGTLRQYASPSWFIDLVAYPSPSSSSAASPILHRCSFTLSSFRAILFLFCSLPSLCVRSTPRARALSLPLLFRPTFCPRVSSRTRGWASLTSSFAPYSSNSCLNWKFYVHSVFKSTRRRRIQYYSSGKKIDCCFFILKMYEIVESLLEEITRGFLIFDPSLEYLAIKV